MTTGRINQVAIFDLACQIHLTADNRHAGFRQEMKLFFPVAANCEIGVPPSKNKFGGPCDQTQVHK